MDIIIQEWGLSGSLHTKEEVLAALAARVRGMLQDDPVGFIQLMYRLDIPEAQLDAAMDGPATAEVVAELVWNRQMQKSILRKSTPKAQRDDEDLTW